MKKNICVVTGTRAEFGLLTPLLEEIKKCAEFELQIIVTGAHLSPEFGLTYRDIEAHGFPISKKIEILLSSDSPTGIGKSMGLAQIGFSEAYEELKPAMVVVLGDRYEILCAASSALIHRIPVVHLSGGEITEGAYDDAFRHSITKMSQLHFTATEEYRERVIQLGENPDTVFNVGAIGLDNIKKMKLLSRQELEKDLNIRFDRYNLLITFHPVTLEDNTAGDQFDALLASLDKRENTFLIFTKANADNDGRTINQKAESYVRDHPGKSAIFASLGQLRYLSAMAQVDAVVGNSSSGIVEAPSFKIGTINIGDRQKGRIRADSIIDCGPDESSIDSAFLTLYSDKFRKTLQSVENPYGSGDTSEKIIKILKKYNFKRGIKKSFYDMNGK